MTCKKVLIVLLIVLALPSYVAYKRVNRGMLRAELKKISRITIGDEGDYVDVAKWIALRKKLKTTLSENNSKIRHIRLAEVELEMPLLGPSFHQKITNPTKWMVDQVEKELSHYDGFSPSDVQNLIDQIQKYPDWVNNHLYARYKVHEGRFYVKDDSGNHNTLKYMNAAFNRLTASVALPDMEWIVSFQDYYHQPFIAAPVFALCKKVDDPYTLIIPDHEYLLGYESFDELLDQKGAEFPWDEKEDLAFWRGSTTSGNYSKPAWQDYPRSRLVFISRDYPKVLDAKFSNLILGAQHNEALKAEEGIFGEFLLPDELIKYKYLIDVDGNASTYSRYYWILRSNCVPIKQVSCFTQWNYAALEPYKHYVPVKEDLSDLKDQILWAKTHPEEARCIAEESRRMVQEELSTDDAYVYLYLLLQSYARLFTHKTGVIL